MTYNFDATTFKGLNSILDDPKVTVAKACQSVEECLAANRDNLRGFFEQCFAPLVARIFGYSGSSWLGQVARTGKEADARALRRLLSPSGPLFTAIYNADADGSTRFHFPRQRLPAHTQMLLATPNSMKSLSTWPQYGQSLDDTAAASKGHIHVSVFQYFCYWFAFYAIKGGDVGASDMNFSSHSGYGYNTSFSSSMRRAADALHLTRGRDADPALRNPYIALLRQMMVELVPRPSTGGASGAGGLPASPLASPRRDRPGSTTPASPYYRSGSGKRFADAASRGLVFYSILLEFWLKDSDEPISVEAATTRAQTRSGVSSPIAPLWSTSYEPPSEDLLEAISELIRYTTVAGNRPATPAQIGASWLPMTPVLTIQTKTATSGGRGTNAALLGPPRLGAASQPGAQALSRQLYRFFHRAFAMWPDQRTIKPLLRAFLAYVAPWQASSSSSATTAGADALTPPGALAREFTAQMTGLVHRVSRQDGQAGTGTSSSAAGSYSSDWDSHVLSNLPFYLELLPLFLERAISRVSVRGETAVQDVLRVMGVLESSPTLVELLRSVERDFNRYSASQTRRAEGPYAELLPWMVEQAQDWQITATANAMGDTPATTRNTPSYVMFATAGDRCAALAAKDLLDLSAGIMKPEGQQRLRKCLSKVLPLEELAENAPAAHVSAAAAGYMSDAPKLPRSSWRDVKFKGDVLERPVTSFEIGPLVRIAVSLSKQLNALLGLNRPWEEGEDPPENRIQEILVNLRQKGWHIDLRPIADVRNLFWFPVAWWVVSTFLKIVWIIIVAIVSGAVNPSSSSSDL